MELTDEGIEKIDRDVPPEENAKNVSSRGRAIGSRFLFLRYITLKGVSTPLRVIYLKNKRAPTMPLSLTQSLPLISPIPSFH
jgi:hypothetical protein